MRSATSCPEDAEYQHFVANKDFKTAPKTIPTVVVAEDDAEFRALLSQQLRADGCEVVEAWDGQALLDYIKRCDSQNTRPDLIIADHNMPYYSGMQILQGLYLTGWQIPVIMITAFGDAHTHAAAARLGATAVFDKPFDVDALRSTVHVCLRKALAPTLRVPKLAAEPKKREVRPKAPRKRKPKALYKKRTRRSS